MHKKLTLYKYINIAYSIIIITIITIILVIIIILISSTITLAQNEQQFRAEYSNE